MRNVSTVTSNSTALTRLGYSEYTATTPIRARTEIWALKEPPTGTNTIVVTLDGALDTYRHAVVGAISFTGVNQSTPTNTVASQTGSSSTCSINVPSASGELAFAVAGHATPAFGLTNAGNTQYWNNSTNSYCRAAGGTKAGASSVTMAWSIGSSIIWAMSGVSLKPAATATFALAEDSKLGIAKSTTKRLRFLVSNTNSNSSGSVQYQLQLQETATCASGTYTAVPTTATDKWQIVNSSLYHRRRGHCGLHRSD